MNGSAMPASAAELVVRAGSSRPGERLVPVPDDPLDDGEIVLLREAAACRVDRIDS